MKGVKWNDATRQRVFFLLASGLSAPEVHDKEPSVALRTVYQWADEWKDTPEFAELRAQKNAEMLDKVNRIANLAMDSLAQRLETESESIAPGTLSAIAGTFFDKRQILSGGATANVGVSGIEGLLNKLQGDGGDY